MPLISITLHSIMLSVVRVQRIIRFWRTRRKREAYFQLFKRFWELAAGLSFHGLHHLAGTFLTYMVANMEIITFSHSSPAHFHSPRQIEMTSIVDAIMHMERSELQRTLPSLFLTIEDKVQEWLKLDLLCLEFPERSPMRIRY